MTTLSSRLLEHAAMHDDERRRYGDQHQAQWTADLREAAELLAPVVQAEPLLKPLSAWSDYGMKSGLLDSTGVAVDRMRAQAAFHAFAAGWNAYVKACAALAALAPGLAAPGRRRIMTTKPEALACAEWARGCVTDMAMHDRCAAELERLHAANVALTEASSNARDILATDRQSLVDCSQIRDSRTDDAVAHGLVWVEEDVWIDSDSAEALRDYCRAIELIDSALAQHGAKQ